MYIHTYVYTHTYIYTHQQTGFNEMHRCYSQCSRHRRHTPRPCYRNSYCAWTTISFLSARRSSVPSLFGRTFSIAVFLALHSIAVFLALHVARLLYLSSSLFLSPSRARAPSRFPALFSALSRYSSVPPWLTLFFSHLRMYSKIKPGFLHSVIYAHLLCL